MFDNEEEMLQEMDFILGDLQSASEAIPDKIKEDAHYFTESVYNLFKIFVGWHDLNEEETLALISVIECNLLLKFIHEELKVQKKKEIAQVTKGTLDITGMNEEEIMQKLYEMLKGK